ncbi:hypothetical protein ZWY2020_059387 [Hordeum vulgare]|nr:hypothetical protein ZWY2020_059387 [Hordeum vulgare]
MQWATGLGPGRVRARYIYYCALAAATALQDIRRHFRPTGSHRPPLQHGAGSGAVPSPNKQLPTVQGDPHPHSCARPALELCSACIPPIFLWQRGTGCARWAKRASTRATTAAPPRPCRRRRPSPDVPPSANYKPDSPRSSTSNVVRRHTYADTGRSRLPLYLDRLRASTSAASPTTLLLDNRLGKCRFDDGYANGSSAARLVLDKECDLLRDLLDRYPDYTLTFTGHSLSAVIRNWLQNLSELVTCTS